MAFCGSGPLHGRGHRGTDGSGPEGRQERGPHETVTPPNSIFWLSRPDSFKVHGQFKLDFRNTALKHLCQTKGLLLSYPQKSF